MARCAQIAAAPLLCLLASCSFFAPEARLRVRLAAPPEHWVEAFSTLRFRLVFPDASGRVEELASADWRVRAAISCSKAGNTPVLAYPEVEGAGEARDAALRLLRPAGGLYPLSLDASAAEPTLVLSWEDGCLALILSRLQALGLDVSLVNAAALAARLRAVPDPWTRDTDTIVEALARGDFSVYDIDALPAREVRVAPEAGDWFFESPFSPVWRVREGETLALASVSLGMHALFGTDGRALRLFVSERDTFMVGNPPAWHFVEVP